MFLDGWLTANAANGVSYSHLRDFLKLAKVEVKNAEESMADHKEESWKWKVEDRVVFIFVFFAVFMVGFSLGLSLGAR